MVSTFAAPPTKPRRASVAADSVIAAAIEIAREAALDVAGAGDVGEHDGVRAEGHRLATHYFRSTAPGYRGWRWAVTMARAPRAKLATVCEVSLLAGEGAIVAPAWMPWSERLQPGDVGRHDVLPYSPDDSRLMQGFEATGDVDVDELAIYELGLGRPRVLSPAGRSEAAIRWYDSDHGPLRASMGGQGDRREPPPKAHCSTCGFLMLMAGSMRTEFGVCANEWSPDDGRVVSMDHGCGAHSETDVQHTGSDWPEKAPVIDEHAIELFDHRAGRDLASAGDEGSESAAAASPAEVEGAEGAAEAAAAAVAEVPSDPDAGVVAAEVVSGESDIAGQDSDSVASGGSVEHGDADEHAPVSDHVEAAQGDAERAPADQAETSESSLYEP